MNINGIIDTATNILSLGGNPNIAHASEAIEIHMKLIMLLDCYNFYKC